MELGSIFLLLALSVLIVLFISRPFFESKNTSSKELSYPSASVEHEFSSALADRDRILNTLYELDFDYDLGKIPEEDYHQQRIMLLEKGVVTLKKLDALQRVSGEGAGGERIETELAARRQQLKTEINGTAPIAVQNGLGNSRSVSVSSDPNDELEALLANRRRTKHEKASGFCPQCGGPLAKSDQFCPKCGVKLV